MNDPAMDARARRIVDEVIDLASSARSEYLDRACAGDPIFRARVESLLAAVEREDPFLSDPTMHLSTTNGPTSGGGRSADTASIRESPGAKIGPYKLLELIGEGGFGSVFMAEQITPIRRRVAMKIIKLGMDTRAVVARFEQERQALAIMEHENIARVFDAGETATGRPYFVMELCKGEPITAYCDSGNLSIRERLELFTQVCRAVQHAHTKGIIHRDIKPSNVLVGTQDGRPLVKIIDFGIAKATQHRLTEKTVFTEFRQLIGTPEYMSPEQAAGSLDIDTRTDVYSLGVLLYELLAGVTPIEPQRLRSAAYGEMQRLIREVDPPTPSTRLSQSTETLAGIAANRRTEPRRLGSIIRGELDWIVMRALDKDRARRFDSPGAFAADLERYLAGEAVEAAPPSAAYRIRKFVFRHRIGVVAGSLIAMALILGIAGTAIGLVQARRQRDRAIEAEQQQVHLRELAESSETKVKLQAERSETVALFVTDMLRGVGPAVARGRDTSIVREILDKTIERLDNGELKDEPLVEADMRHIVGVTLSDLGLYDRAITMHREALRLRIAAAGEESEDTTLSLNDLGKTLWQVRNYEEAEQLLRRALDIRRKMLGPDVEYIGISTNNLGMLLKERGDFDGAETMLRESLRIRQQTTGIRSSDTAISMANLAVILAERKDYAGAEPIAREAVAIDREVSPAGHPNLAHTTNTLGRIVEKLGKIAEAEALLRESLAVRREVLGEGHPLLGSSAETLASFLQRTVRAGAAADRPAKSREAITLYQEALRIAEARTPTDLTKRARLLNLMSRSLADDARFTEAERSLLESQELIENLPGLPIAKRAESMGDLAAMYAAWEKAEPGKGHATKGQEWLARQRVLEPASPAPSLP